MDSSEQLLDGEESVSNEFVSFFSSRWSTNVEGEVPFILLDPIGCHC